MMLKSGVEMFCVWLASTCTLPDSDMLSKCGCEEGFCERSFIAKSMQARMARRVRRTRRGVLKFIGKIIN